MKRGKAKIFGRPIIYLCGFYGKSTGNWVIGFSIRSTDVVDDIQFDKKIGQIISLELNLFRWKFGMDMH